MSKTVIIGDGVFGLSTATFLSSQNRPFILCGKRDEHAPSQDVAKISRLDYPGPHRMEEAMLAHEQWTTGDFYKQFCTPNGRIVAYDSNNSKTLSMINENRVRFNLPPRPAVTSDTFKAAFGGPPDTDLVYVFNDDDLLIDWASVMTSLRSAVKKETRSPFKSLMLEDRRIKAVVLDDGKIHDTTESDVVLAAGPWTMNILLQSKLDGPPDGLPNIAVLAFHLRLNDEQIGKYSDSTIFSHIGTGK